MHGLPATLVDADGRWSLPCRVLDILPGSAKIALAELPEDIDLADFGLKFREAPPRSCRLVRRDGNDIVVVFVDASPNPTDNDKKAQVSR